MSGPTYQNFLPGSNEQNVVPSSPVYFEVRSPLGVVHNSINVSFGTGALGQAIINGQFQPGFTGSITTTINGYNVYAIGSVPFVEGNIISVYISSTDFGSVSSSTTYNFTIYSSNIVAPVTIAQPRGGTFQSIQTIQLLTSEPAVTHYTVDGSTPSISSPVYTAPIHVNQTTILKFFSVDVTNNIENVKVEVYQINIPQHDTTTPITTSDVQSGQYQNLKFVTLTTNEPATIYYSFDSKDPDPTNPNTKQDTSPVTIELQQGHTELRFFAVDSKGNRETVKTRTYVIEGNENNIVPTNVFVSYPYIKNTLDICWDDMIPINGDIVGYNLYRSQSDVGDFTRINKTLINSTFYRDQSLDKTIVSEDVSEQFRFMTAIDASTDFEGQIVDAEKWETINTDQLFHQSDGIRLEDVFGGQRQAWFQSKFRMKADFDIETTFEIFTLPITAINLIESISFVIAFNQYTYIEISRERRNATDYLVSRLIVESAEISKTEIINASLTGKLKITRVGQDISTYYYDGSAWILLNSYLNFSENNLQVRFHMLSADKPISARFQSFKVNTGQAYLPLMKCPQGDVNIQVKHKPITSRTLLNTKSDKEYDVDVFIDGKKALIKKVDGIEGVITLNLTREYDYVLQKWIEPVIPTSESVVTVTYQHNVNFVKLALRNTYFYKVTAVLLDGTETRLSLCPAEYVKADKVDWMYKEAIRRNSWLLDQTGERVLLFIKKTTGTKCKCFERNERTHAQAKVGSCKECWGTGFVGGYDGPYEMRIAPLQTEQKIALTDRGLKLDNVQDTWTTVTPVINQRDFIVRRNNMIYGIGPVSRPEIRGVALQQHFQIGYFDTTDIRYEFIESLDLFGYKQKTGLRGPFVHYSEDQGITEGDVAEKDKLRTNKATAFNNEKGRVITFENQNF